jgi:hypothetical protein
LSLNYEQQGDVKKEDDADYIGSVFCALLGDQHDAQVAFHKISFMIPKDPVKPYWATTCLEIKVQLVGCKGEMCALLEFRSKLRCPKSFIRRINGWWIKTLSGISILLA